MVRLETKLEASENPEDISSVCSLVGLMSEIVETHGLGSEALDCGGEAEMIHTFSK